jgi:hypothetical protein
MRSRPQFVLALPIDKAQQAGLCQKLHNRQDNYNIKRYLAVFIVLKRSFSAEKRVFETVFLEAGEPNLSARGGQQNGYPEAGEKI